MDKKTKTDYWKISFFVLLCLLILTLVYKGAGGNEDLNFNGFEIDRHTLETFGEQYGQRGFYICEFEDEDCAIFQKFDLRE
jgi:hypothetical protein